MISYNTGEVILTAPENYEISSDKKEFNKEIRIEHNKEEPVAKYYLRNKDASSEYYDAISTEQSIQYCNEEPGINGDISIELIKSNDEEETSSVSVYDKESKIRTLMTKFDVKMTVPVAKYKGVPIDTQVILTIDNDGEQEKPIQKIITEQKFRDTEGENVNVDFTINVNPSEQKKMCFTVTISNALSLGQVSTGNTIKFVQNEKKYSVLIIDKKPAIAELIEPEEENNRKEFNVKISDENGIKKVEYNWDEKEYSSEKIWIEGTQTYKKCSISDNQEYVFSLENDKTKTQDGKTISLSKSKDNEHTLWLRVTDKVGNEIVYQFTQQSPDNKAPEIKDVDITIKKESKINEITKTSFGNFFNQNVTLKVKVKDKDNSAISSVILMSENNQNLSKSKDDWYTVVLPVGNTYDLTVKTVDKWGNEQTTELVNILKDKDGTFKNNCLTLEQYKPTINVIRAENVKQVSENDKIKDYYGKNSENKSIQFKIIDNKIKNGDTYEEVLSSGIQSVTITDNGKEIPVEEFTDKQEEFIFTTKKISELGEGKHRFEIIVKDNSGNETTKTYVFTVDLTPPEGKFIPKQPKNIEKNGENTYWFNSKTEILVETDITEDNLDTKNTKVKVDGKLVDWKNICISEKKHSHKITGILYDKAGNSANFEELIVYRDFAIPKFESVTVKTAENTSALDKVLNVLSFGIYSNTNITITAKVSDGNADSGINRVVINYEDKDDEKFEEVRDNDGTYLYHSYTFDVMNKEEYKKEGKDYTVFASDIIITVYDNFGKSATCKEISKDSEEVVEISEPATVPETPTTSEDIEPTVSTEISTIPESSESATVPVTSPTEPPKTTDMFVMIENGKPNITISDEREKGKTKDWYKADENIKVTITDEDSGIDKVSLTDNGNIIEEINKKNQETKETRTINIESLSEGKHTLKVEVTDNSGNTNASECEFSVDKTAPEISEFDIVDNEGNSVVEKITKTQFGNYYNEAITFKITAEDVINQSDNISGVKSVSMSVNGTGDKEILDYKETGIYEFSLNMDSLYENISFTVTDNADNSENFELKTLLHSTTNDILLENYKPTVNVIKADDVKKQDTDYYGISSKGKNIKFVITDDKIKDKDVLSSGLKSIEITDTYQKVGKKVFTKNDFDKDTFEFDDFEQEISELELNEGLHTFKVIVIDNSGNEEELEYTFVVDFTKPTGKFDTQRTKDGNQPVTIIKNSTDTSWFDKDTVIEIKVNMKDTNLDRAEIQIDGGETQIIKEIDKIISVKRNGNNHTHTIKGKVYDKAGNEKEFNQLVLYRDFDAPKIESVTVLKKDKSSNSTLNVLPFGVYSNGAVTVQAKVLESKDDSGIDKVILSYGNSKKEVMKFSQKENVYTCTCDLSLGFSAEDIKITAYDKFGKDSSNKGTEYPVFQDEDEKGKKTNNRKIMLEKVEPTVTINMPVSDAEGRVTNSYWYNPNRSDKNIELKVRDENSGIREMLVYVNDNLMNVDSKNNKFLISDDTGKAESAVTSEKSYSLSINKLVQNMGVPDNGKYTIKVTVTDNAGNEKTVTQEYYVDNKNPDVVKFHFASVHGYQDISQWITVLEYGFYFQDDFEITVDLSDENPSSGLQKIAYKLVSFNERKNEKAFTETTLNGDKSATFLVSANFKGQIYVKVYDNTNNESEERTPQAFVIDTEYVHGLENHIEMTHQNNTNYKDMVGNALYTNDETVDVTIIDTVSGIQSVSYSISSENQNVAETKTEFQNTGYAVGNIIDGWLINKMDENLITELKRSFNFAEDNNDIVLKISMNDRATNISSKDQIEKPNGQLESKFTIDKTAPIIEVTFEENVEHNNEYYRGKRKATINVTERNFDEKGMEILVNNNKRNLTFNSVDNTKDKYSANIEFDEGDYSSFTVRGTDCSGRLSKEWSSNKFYIDLTNPKITPKNESEFKNSGNNPFSKNKVMEFTITEHNFADNLVNVQIKNGQGIKPQISGSGDVHTLKIPFEASNKYNVSITVTDKSGRKSEIYNSPDFEIDKDNPKLVSPKNKKVLDYVKGDDTIENIIFEDKNISKVTVEMSHYTIKDKRVVKGSTPKFEVTKVQNNKNIIVDLNDKMKNDGVYEVKTVAYDKSGRNSGEKTHTFIVLRKHSIMFGLSESEETYQFDGKGRRSDDIKNIKIDIYLKKGHDFAVTMDDKLLDKNAEYMKVEKEECANGIICYHVTVKKDYITTTYNDSEIERELTLNVSEQGNDKTSEPITVGDIKIDNEPPKATYQNQVMNMSWYQGYYDNNDEKPLEIVIENVSPDVDIESCKFFDNDRAISYKSYDEEMKLITIELKSGEHEFYAVIYDYAGNSLPMSPINVYVGSIFGRWWVKALLGLSVVTIGVGVYLLVMFFKKKHR